MSSGTIDPARSVAVIDYGMGNLRSVEKGFHQVGVEAFVTSDPDLVDSSAGVVLPGVGAFGDAMDHLRESGLAKAVYSAVGSDRPFLGVCLGLQLLFERSSENGDHEGLGIFKGVVERLEGDMKIPHMGWNQVKKIREPEILADVPENADFYFVHSYVVKPSDESIIAAVTDYGGDFVSGVARGSNFAFQFHPEKSGSIGLTILRRFGAMCGAIRKD